MSYTPILYFTKSDFDSVSTMLRELKETSTEVREENVKCYKLEMFDVCFIPSTEFSNTNAIIRKALDNAGMVYEAWE